MAKQDENNTDDKVSAKSNGGNGASTTAPTGNAAQQSAQQSAQPPEGPQFAIRQVYLKDASFESPRNPATFQGSPPPKFNLNIQTPGQKIADDLYEVTLQINVEARIEANTETNTEERVAFLVEVQQAGVFFCKDLSDQQMEQLLATACPNILFPYAREAIDNLLTRGGFPALMLAPLNFDALYAQRKQKAAEQANNGGGQQGNGGTT
ncbi:MAG: protein-export chaperone SecB [Pseudohongiellaceae bacterium]